jgi:hypothetical protein
MTLGVIITIRFQEDSSFSFLLFYLIYLFISSKAEAVFLRVTAALSFEKHGV